MMFKKSKLVNILSSLLLGTVVGAAILLLVVMTSNMSVSEKPELVLITDSNEKVYDGTPLTDSGWDLRGDLAVGHKAEVEFRGTRTNVGETENTATLRIVDVLGTDVTEEYQIRYEFGMLKVTPRLLIITSDSAFKLFDETPLTAPKYEISESCDGLVIGHREVVEVTGLIIDIGKTNNTIASVKILDSEDNEVTGNYSLVLREGLLAIDDGSSESIFGDGTSNLLPSAGMEDVVIYSVWSEVSEYVYLKVQSYGDYTGAGWEAAPVYAELLENTYSAAYLTSCALEDAGLRAKTVRIKSFCNDYGLPYYFRVGSGEAQSDDTFFCGNTDDIYEIEYYGLISDMNALYTPYLSYEKAYRDFVYANYLSIDEESLAYMQALIKKEGFSADDPTIVSAVASYIQNAADYNKDYPIELESEPNVAIAFLEKYKEGVCRHYASAAVLLYRALGIPARYTVGALAEAQAGEWTDVKAASAHAWAEIYLNGIGWVMVEVTGSPDDTDAVTVKPATVRYPYDGKSHSAISVLQGFEEYELRGYTYEVEIEGSRTEIGKTDTVIKSLKIFNSAGKDVTFRFKIKTETGVLQVYREKLVMVSEDESFVYGSISETPIVGYDFSDLNEILIVRISRETDIGAGEHLNRFDVMLFDENGKDVTDEYWISRKYGVLTVEPLQITLKADDAQKAYDGEALSCDTFTVVDGELVEGHDFGFYEFSGSQRMIGVSENEIVHVSVHNEYGKNVTANYVIVLLPGQLKVTAS